MKLRLTNTSSAAVPLISTEGEGFAEALGPQMPYSLDDPDIDVLVIGDKPSVREQLGEGLGVLKDSIAALLTAWRSRSQLRAGEQTPVVKVTVENEGENAVRVLLGGSASYDVASGEAYEAEAMGYLELRELGDVAQGLVEQPATAV